MVSEIHAAVIAFIAALLGMLIVSIVDSQFEEARCYRLEELTNINMTYSYSKGCQLISEL